MLARFWIPRWVALFGLASCGLSPGCSNQQTARTDAMPPNTHESRVSRNAQIEERKAAWQIRSNWRQLKPGMTQQEVSSLLGPATRVSVEGEDARWQYALDAPTFDEYRQAYYARIARLYGGDTVITAQMAHEMRSGYDQWANARWYEIQNHSGEVRFVNDQVEGWTEP